MADSNRIKTAKDKADFVKALTALNDTTGPFQTYADVLVFAAALGAKYKKRTPLGEVSKREPAPIPQEQFFLRGYDMVINLIAMTETKDTKILSSKEENINSKRNYLFEEYANGGLEILQTELRGAVDYSERLLLILNSERFKQQQQEGEFDLSRFLS